MFKAMFGRLKDEVDIASMLEAGAVDAQVLRGTLVELVGSDGDAVGTLQRAVEASRRG